MNHSDIAFQDSTRSALALSFAAILALTACTNESHHESDDHEHHTPKVATHSAPAGPDADGEETHDTDGHRSEVRLTREAIERYSVTIEAARRWELEPTFAVPARVELNAEAVAHIGSPVRGRAVEIKVRLGDVVKRGDGLVVLESPDLGEAQADYVQKQAASQSSVSLAIIAKDSWERARSLYEQSQGISLAEVQRREAEYKAAVATQKAAESGVIGAEHRLHLLGMSRDMLEELVRTGEIIPRYTIAAPMDGQVIQRELTLGELVTPERDSLMVVADCRTLWILADVPVAKLDEVALGARAWLTIGAGGANRFEGRVAFVAPLVDPNSQTAQVRIETPSAATGRLLKPGMFAQVEIAARATDERLTQSEPVVAVPDEAIQTVEGRTAIFVPVPNEPGTFSKRTVAIGRSVGGRVPVYSGLKEGDLVVVKGTFILKAELGKAEAAHEH